VVSPGSLEKGFKGAMLLTDPGTGKAISVTLWETEADMTVIEAGGWWQEQIARFGSVMAGSPVREHYQVRVQV